MTTTTTNDLREARLRELSADITSLIETSGAERLLRARQVNEATHRELWRLVGAETADMMYLEGKGLREIAEAVNAIGGEQLTHMGAKHWAEKFGPRSYLLIRQMPGGGYETLKYRLDFGDVRKHRAELAALVTHGYRVVPAAWLIDSDDLDLERAWRTLGQPKAARGAFAAS